MAENTGNVRAPLRGAIIGLGNAAVYAHLPVWRASGDFCIEAIVEPVPERVEIGKKLLPQAQVYPDLQALLSENAVDFVDICTPPCFHAELVLAACGSGVHVMCEKPLSIPSHRIEEIQQAAQRTQGVVFTVNNWKYAPLWIKVAELIRENRIGTIQSISLNVLRPPNSGGGLSDWRKCIDVAQGGILIDHGWHNLYLILSLLREIPSSMAVNMVCASGDGLEETVDLAMRFREAEARLHLTWRASCRRNYGTIAGTRGSLFVNDDHLLLHSNDSPPARFDFAQALSAGSHHPEWMEPVVENFRREILDARYRGVNLTEAAWCSRLIDLAYSANKNAMSVIDVCSEHPQTPFIMKGKR
jgi:predicted dehydrogenase